VELRLLTNTARLAAGRDRLVASGTAPRRQPGTAV